jgi:4-amino-4-deoxy-L-arabinose transferase-like glycosyltransferase
VHEHWERFFLKTHDREGPWYYFFAMLVPGIMPWLGALPQALFNAARRERGATFQPRLLLLIWAVFIFFFFSYSNSKLPGYILPIFPALALLLGAYLDRRLAPAAQIAAGLLAAIGVAGLACAAHDGSVDAPSGRARLAGSLPAVGDGGRLCRRSRRRAGVVA